MNTFDNAVERAGTNCLKWDLHPELSPYWIADMDFKSPDCILDAMKMRIDHGVFGYALAGAEFCDVLVSYMKQRHQAAIKPEWIVHIGGCVPALATAAVAFCRCGDSVMTCGPVYPPIRNVHAGAEADLIEVPHVFKDNKWTFDWEAMEQAVRPDTKMFILCNPQNPLGRVFDRDELIRLADFCRDHDMILCSDEIHCDLVLDEQATHTTILNLPEEYLDRVLMFTAPSKTFNIAGIGYTMAVIPDPKLRASFDAMRERMQPPVHCMAFTAAEAAYSQGEPWRQKLIAHLRNNRDILYRFVAEHMPLISMTPMQATYLAWMDCSKLNLENPQAFFIEKAGVFLNSGEPFGSPQHVRFNFGTSTPLMLQGLEKMRSAIDGIKGM